MKKEIEALIKFLEEEVKKWAEEKEPYCYYPYEICVDCRMVVHTFNRDQHPGHTIIMQDGSHGGVSEWIKCLKWVKEK